MSPAPPALWRHNVAAIVTDAAGNVLLGGTPGRSRHWHFPQGGVKPGESAAEALQRELSEEVGIRSYTVLAEYPGLRYEYRRHNEKRKRWLGQQQVYYLLRVPGVAPAADCSGSTEFTATRWVHHSGLDTAELAPFKRAVAAQALAHFFPGGGDFTPAQSTPLLYRCTAGQLPPPPVPGTPLFGGGKAEAACHMARLLPQRVGKKERWLVALLGMPGAGLKKALRHTAHALDPLTTRYAVEPGRYRGLPDELLPLPGELSLLALPTDAPELPALGAWLSRCRAEGVRTLCIGLHISRAKQLQRMEAKGKSADSSWEQDWCALQRTLAQLPGAVYLIPSDCAWYRDYLLSLLPYGIPAQEG